MIILTIIAGIVERRSIGMICEINNNQNEVVLKNATFSDVLAVIYIWLHKDKEIAFEKPRGDTDESSYSL